MGSGGILAAARRRLTAPPPAPGPVDADYIEATITRTGIGTYAYYDMTSITDYTVQAGDVLEYDLWRGTNDYLAVDFGFTAGSPLRDSGAVDQNGQGTHPQVGLGGEASGQWYHRRISLASKVGSVINKFMLAEDNGGPPAGAYTGRVRRVVITDGAGTIRKTIWNGGALPTFALDGAAGATMAFALGYEFDPRQLGNLYRWHSLNDCKQGNLTAIATLIDRSGNGRHVTQATAGKQPLVGSTSGRYFAEFDGVDDELTGLLNNGGFQTMYAVCIADANNTRTVMQDRVGMSLTATQWGTYDRLNDEPVNTGVPSVLSASIAAAEIRYQRNGTKKVVPFYPNDSAKTAFRIGSNEGIQFFDGRVFEVLLFNATHTLQEQARVMAYLGAKYGITVDLASYTPFATGTKLWFWMNVGESFGSLAEGAQVNDVPGRDSTGAIVLTAGQTTAGQRPTKATSSGVVAAHFVAANSNVLLAGADPDLIIGSAGGGYAAVLKRPDTTGGTLAAGNMRAVISVGEDGSWGGNHFDPGRISFYHRFGTGQANNNHVTGYADIGTSFYGAATFKQPSNDTEEQWIKGKPVATFTGKLDTLTGTTNIMRFGVGIIGAGLDGYLEADVAHWFGFKAELTLTERQLFADWMEYTAAGGLPGFSDNFDTAINGVAWYADKWAPMVGASGITRTQQIGRGLMAGTQATAGVGTTSWAKNHPLLLNYRITGLIARPNNNEGSVRLYLRSAGLAAAAPTTGYFIELMYSGTRLYPVRANAVGAVLATVAAPPLTVRFMAELNGNTIRFRSWDAAGADDGIWDINVTDAGTLIPPGVSGLGLYQGTSIVANVAEFDDIVVTPL